MDKPSEVIINKLNDKVDKIIPDIVDMVMLYLEAYMKKNKIKRKDVSDELLIEGALQTVDMLTDITRGIYFISQVIDSTLKRWHSKK